MAFFILFPFMFLFDYVLTYIGVNNSIIIEANPLMIWLFELPFSYGLIVRILIGAVLTSMLWLGRSAKIFNVGCKVILTANSIVFTLHFIWILKYILYR